MTNAAPMSVRTVLRESRDYHGDRIKVERVGVGWYGNEYISKEHFTHTKYRGDSFADRKFDTEKEANTFFHAKRDKSIDLIEHTQKPALTSA